MDIDLVEREAGRRKSNNSNDTKFQLFFLLYITAKLRKSRNLQVSISKT